MTQLGNLIQLVDGTKAMASDVNSNFTTIRNAHNDTDFKLSNLLNSVNIKNYGAVGDGFTDDSAAFQAAFADCHGSGKALNLPLAKYKINSPLIYDHSKFSIIAEPGTVLDFSSINGTGLMIQCVNSDNNALYSCRNKGIYNVVFQGQQVSGHNCIALGDQSGTTYAGANAIFSGCQFIGFDTVFTFGSHTYNITWENCDIRNCNLAINFPANLTDSGEKSVFIGGGIYNCGAILNTSAGDFNFIGASLDYFSNYAVNAQYGSFVRFSDCHIESNSDETIWLSASGSLSIITLTDCNIMITGNKTNYLFCGSSPDGGVFLNGTTIEIGNADITYPNQTWGTGFTYFKLVNYDSYQAGGVRTKEVSYLSNILSDGGFEVVPANNIFSRSDWRFPNSNTLDYSIDNTVFNTGLYSLKINPRQGNQVTMVKSIDCTAGSMISMSFYIKNTISNGIDDLTVKIQFYDASGHAWSQQFMAMNPSNPVLTYNQANQFATFTEQRLKAAAPAPQGTAFALIIFETNSSAYDGSSAHWLDNIIINVSNYSSGALGYLNHNTIPAIPTIAGTTTAGTGTYTTQVMNYTLHGSRVLFDISLIWTAHTGTGNIQINGLPFLHEWTSYSALNIWVNGITYSSGSSPQANIIGGSNYITVGQSSSNGTVAPIPMHSSGTIFVSGSYEVT